MFIADQRRSAVFSKHKSRNLIVCQSITKRTSVYFYSLTQTTDSPVFSCPVFNFAIIDFLFRTIPLREIAYKWTLFVAIVSWGLLDVR